MMLALLVAAAPALACGGVTRLPPPGFWSSVIEKGILNGSYLSFANCEGTVWDDFRTRYQAHVDSGQWNLADSVTWIHEPNIWKLVKAAEVVLETWRRIDLWEGPEDTTTMEQAMSEIRRSAMSAAFGVLDPKALTHVAATHLERMARGEEVATESFGAKCLLGLLAAIVVFARALAALGEGSELMLPDNGEDGFALWRAEMGYVVAGLMLFEGATLVDLTVMPGWPGVEARLIESMLHWRRGEFTFHPEEGAEADESTTENMRRHVTLGEPRILSEDPPARFPPAERVHRGVDPMGVTRWGHTAGYFMAERTKLLMSFVSGEGPSMDVVGASWIRRCDPGTTAAMGRASRRARMMAFISQHGSLDLELPSLLEVLFPDFLEVRYLLYGERTAAICKITHDAAIIRRLCRDRDEGRVLEVPFKEPESWKNTVFERRALLSPKDPRLRFPGGALPDVFAVSSWSEAIWAVRFFPEARVLLFFGPPLLLQISSDFEKGRKAVTDDFWHGFDQLYEGMIAERCVVAAESLFRSEQFYFQVGIEVPFLRPMSVWVNATYNPRRLEGPSRLVGRVLVHNRGRLKYESFFIRILSRMAGPAFPYEVFAQSGKIVPFVEIAEFHAVVIIPWSPELCILRNIFKMRVPLFVPARTLLRNLVHISNQRLLPAKYYLQHPRMNTALMRNIHPYDPFLDTARPAADPIGVAARAYWAEYSEYLLLPLMQHFSGAADLLVRLYNMEGRKLSAQMRNAYLQDMEEMRSFWSDSLVRVLGPVVLRQD